MSAPVRVISRGRRTAESPREFPFAAGMVPGAENPGGPSAYRQHAWEVFQATELPHIRLEPWRRTNLEHMPIADFHLPEFEVGSANGRSSSQNGGNPFSIPPCLLAPLAGETFAGRILIDTTGTRVEQASGLAERGVIFTSYAEAERNHPVLIEKIRGQAIRPEDGKFAALASAFARQGVLLYVPSGVEVVEPFQFVFWAGRTETAHLAHILICLEQGASATYVQETASAEDPSGHSMFCGVVEGLIGPGANFKYVELQSLGQNVWNFMHERLRVERDGQVDWIFGAAGSHLTKNFSNLDLAGQGASGRMSGFYFTEHDQHLDHDTQQNHLAAHTTSDLLFKGALKGRSRSVWQGMIYVAPGAQRADGYQANRNLVLEPAARADSIPGLEILADDVRCTHGATVGKIDPEQLFYLQARGIPRPEAERLVVEGFFDPIMQRIPFEGVRQRFQNAIYEKLASQEPSS